MYILLKLICHPHFSKTLILILGCRINFYFTNDWIFYKGNLNENKQIHIAIYKHISFKLLVDVSKRIGFTASVSSASSSWSSGTLVFPLIITNVGNGYNPSTGVFTAPIEGEYVFFVNVQSYNTQCIYVDVVLNGVTKVRTMAYSTGSNDNYESGPNLAVLTLQKGNRVWVQRYSGQGYYIDGPITTFSGFLL